MYKMPHQISVVGCNIVDEDGLFKATVLWDKIVTHLEESIKCSRHTQSLRTYTNCFQGSKAVDCLLVHLNKTMPKEVKRHQVQTLCQKLVLTGVVEAVRDKEKGVFREGRLYRLTRNHFWTHPSERKKLPRTRSAEEICADKVSDCDDLKGYASDSTVSHSAAAVNQVQPTRRRRRKCKERGPGGGGEGGGEQLRYTKEHKPSPPPPLDSPPPPRLDTTPPPRLPPLNLGMLRMKSTGSILNTPDCTPSSVLCESRDNLLSDARHRRKTSAHRRSSRPEPSHTMLSLRRGSMDNGLGQVGRVCGACGVSPCKPPRRGTRGREDSRHQGKERTLRHRHQSRSLKGDKDRSHKAGHCDDEEEESCVRKCSLNRSLSFSSVGDYERTEARVHFEPFHSSTSGSKWIVYGFL